MKARNQKHRVPEYVLYFPELRDECSLIYYRLDEATGRYREVKPSKDGFFESAPFPGLSLHLLPPDRWEEGHKADLYFRGERFLRYQEILEKLKHTEEKLERVRGRFDKANKAPGQEAKLAERETEAHRATWEKLRQAQEKLQNLRQKLKRGV